LQSSSDDSRNKLAKSKLFVTKGYHTIRIENWEENTPGIMTLQVLFLPSEKSVFKTVSQRILPHQTPSTVFAQIELFGYILQKKHVLKIN
jgi:hypothetical protein